MTGYTHAGMCAKARQWRASALPCWYVMTRRAQWRSPADVKADYRSASVIGNNHVVFNIKGNTYRLVVMAAYQQGRIFIRFVALPPTAMLGKETAPRFTPTPVGNA
jgi:mRNA-degrading endonuclease HigB of HigAB toxin-antitoxin module